MTIRLLASRLKGMRSRVPLSLRNAELIAILSAIAAITAAGAAIASYHESQHQAQIAAEALEFQKQQFRTQRHDDERKAEEQRQDDLRHERQHAEELGRTLKESDRSGRAAEASVSIARSSLELQREQFQEANRAWVVFKGVSIGRKFELDKPGLFLATLTNQTNSVAVGLRVEGMVKIGEPVTHADLQAVENRPYSGAQVDVGQHIDEQIPVDSIPITSPLVESITNGTSVISFYGKYSYSDQFARQHEDHWCAYFIYNQAVDQFGQANCPISLASPRR